MIVTMATPAFAQGFSPNLFEESKHFRTDEEVKQEQDRERAYKSGISKIPDQKAKVDPWGTVRSTPAPANPQRPASK
jgi:hypothetical protein